jgi:protein-L-isoaspartate(D-aspartate) O-methyltransferase
VAGVADDPALLAAFAAVPREAFLGPPPWRIRIGVGPQRGDRQVPADPVLVYQDALFALAPERGVNNGSPSLHAWMLYRLAPRPGYRVLHVGVGGGYYTALLAEMVGPGGRVTAVEIDPALAEVARANLRGYVQVEVLAADAAAHPAGEVDRVYVNASVGRPAAPWVARLAPGGRLVFPLGVAPPARVAGGPRHAEVGGAFLMERVAAVGRPLRAEWLGPAYFVHVEGALAPDGPEAAALRRSLARRDADFVRSLHWGDPQPAPERCWFWSPGWSLGYDPPG